MHKHAQGASGPVLLIWALLCYETNAVRTQCDLRPKKGCTHVPVILLRHPESERGFSPA